MHLTGSLIVCLMKKNDDIEIYRTIVDSKDSLKTEKKKIVDGIFTLMGVKKSHTLISEP